MTTAKDLARALLLAVGTFVAAPLCFYGVMVIGLRMPWSWQSVVVPLPLGAGQMTVSGIDDLWDDEYDRWINVRLSDGSEIESDIPSDRFGTHAFLHWQPASVDGGPYVLIEDRVSNTWINLGAKCLAAEVERSVGGTIDGDDWCRITDLPTRMEWQYFGRIEADTLGMAFIPGTMMPRQSDWRTEEMWPRPVRLAYEIVSKRAIVPGTTWSFVVIRRSHPRFLWADEWIELTDTIGRVVRTWFDRDCVVCPSSTVFLHPERGGSGPFLQIGRYFRESDVFDRRKTILVDLGARRSFHVDGRLPEPTSTPIHPDRHLAIAVDDVLGNDIGLDVNDLGYFDYRTERMVWTSDGVQFPVYELPAGLRLDEGHVIGKIPPGPDRRNAVPLVRPSGIEAQSESMGHSGDGTYRTPEFKLDRQG